jgi:hypothetical protein
MSYLPAENCALTCFLEEVDGCTYSLPELSFTIMLSANLHQDGGIEQCYVGLYTVSDNCPDEKNAILLKPIRSICKDRAGKLPPNLCQLSKLFMCYI